MEKLYSFKKFISKIIEKIERIIFCGAGISLHSGLPLTNDCVRYVSAKVNITKKDTEAIINSNFPFEAFIETLSKAGSIDRIFEMFDIGEPNTNHILLAKLAKAKYLRTICTTNFDKLLEKALESEGLVRGSDFQVFYRENDFGNID